MASDRLTDSLERHWMAGAPLGRGTWGRTRMVRDAQGREAVLKEPLTEADFQADVPLPEDLIAACRGAARQQADLLYDAERPCLPRLEATADLGHGRVGLILPRYDTLERRLGAGSTLGDVLALVHKVATVLAEAGFVHGNLRPSNVLFDERGDIVLADAATPALVPHHARLADQAECAEWLPPEARHRSTSGRPGPARPPGPLWDTWALCQLVHAAILLEEGQFPPRLRLAAGGLDKVALVALKDAAHARLTAEGSNPRFRSRVTDRLGALLSRGLSTDFEPSPPYRFATPRDLAERLSEVLALLRPRVTDVGKILLPASAPDGVFTGKAGASAVGFSVTVGCTPGLSDPDDLVCGLQLVDLDSPTERRAVDDAELSVQVHPSGRLRFQVQIPEVAPGRYRIRVAFAVRDSGDEPVVANGEFEVRPPPGYVPPRKEPAAPSAIPFTPAPAAARPTAPAPRPAEEAPRPAGKGQVVDLFPRPVAPPDADLPDPSEPSDVSSAGGEERLSADANTPPAVQRTEVPAREPLYEPLVDSPPPPSLRPAPPTLSPMSPVPRADDRTDGLDTQELLDTATPPTVRRTHSPSGSIPPIVDLPGPAASGDLEPPPPPTSRSPSGRPSPFAAVVDLVRRDPNVSLGTAIAAALVLVLVTTALAENCR